MFIVKLTSLGQVNCGRDNRVLREREDNEGYPLVTINSSGDRDAGRNINPSAPMVTTVYSTGTDEPDAIRKLYPLIIGDPEKNKSEN